MTKIALLLIAIFFLFGCAKLPSPQICVSSINQISNDSSIGMSRVFVLKPQRSFAERFSLLGDNTTSLLSAEKYEILYESIDNKIGDIREARIVYFDVPKGVHKLYVKTNTLSDTTYVSDSITVFDASDTIYFILQDTMSTSSSITGRDYLQGYSQVTKNQFMNTLQESCDRLNVMKVSKLTIGNL